MLERFKKEHNIEGKINYVLGGPIPGGLQRPLKYKNILFVGDAGVGAFPLTGQGIYRALLSGEAAGQCIALNYPRKYPHLMNQMFIKWDVIGKSFVRLIYVLREVGPKSVELASRYFMDFHGKLLLGDLKTQTLEKVFESPMYNRLKEYHSTGSFPDDLLCKDCEQRNKEKEEACMNSSKYTDLKDRVKRVSTTHKKFL